MNVNINKDPGAYVFGSILTICGGYLAAAARLGDTQGVFSTTSAICSVSLFGGLLVSALALGGCGSTDFHDEGPGQATDRASGRAPAGSLGVCRLKGARRPEVVSPTLWEHAETCSPRTPDRYARIGYGDASDPQDPQIAVVASRLQMVDGARQVAADGNMLLAGLMRGLRTSGVDNPRLAARVDRSAGGQSCDYARFFTAARAKSDALGRGCTAKAYDPVERRDVCLFADREDIKWLTGGYDCLAFSQVSGQGMSCATTCDGDDYCLAQVACTTSDFDLVMCGVGICLPAR